MERYAGLSIAEIKIAVKWGPGRGAIILQNIKDKIKDLPLNDPTRNDLLRLVSNQTQKINKVIEKALSDTQASREYWTAAEQIATDYVWKWLQTVTRMKSTV